MLYIILTIAAFACALPLTYLILHGPKEPTDAAHEFRKHFDLENANHSDK